MDTATIKAVLLGTPGMSDSVRDVMSDPSTEIGWIILRINELLEEYGWDIRVTEALVRDLYDDLNPAYVFEIKTLDLDEEDEGPQPAQEETAPVTIKKVTYVNGMDIEAMSVEQFLGAIKATDKEIKRLKEMDIDSTTIEKQIRSLEDDKAKLVELLDQQHSDD